MAPYRWYRNGRPCAVLLSLILASIIHAPTDPAFTQYGYEIDTSGRVGTDQPRDELFEGELGGINGEDDGDTTMNWRHDSTNYVIDKVVRAERVAGKYRIWLQWKGYNEKTWRFRHELARELDPSSELWPQIDQAVAAERDRHNADCGDHDWDDEVLNPRDDTASASPAVSPPVVIDDPGATLAQRRHPRAVLAKHPHATVGVNNVLEAKVSVATDHLRQLAYISLCSSRYVACDSEVYASGMPSVHAFMQSCY